MIKLLKKKLKENSVSKLVILICFHPFMLRSRSCQLPKRWGLNSGVWSAAAICVQGKRAYKRSWVSPVSIILSSWLRLVQIDWTFAEKEPCDTIQHGLQHKYFLRKCFHLKIWSFPFCCILFLFFVIIMHVELQNCWFFFFNSIII